MCVLLLCVYLERIRNSTTKSYDSCFLANGDAFGVEGGLGPPPNFPAPAAFASAIMAAGASRRSRRFFFEGMADEAAGGGGGGGVGSGGASVAGSSGSSGSEESHSGDGSAVPAYL